VTAARANGDDNAGAVESAPRQNGRFPQEDGSRRQKARFGKKSYVTVHVENSDSGGRVLDFPNESWLAAPDHFRPG
jgi:hypothetical protein